MTAFDGDSGWWWLVVVVVVVFGGADGVVADADTPSLGYIHFYQDGAAVSPLHHYTQRARIAASFFLFRFVHRKRPH